MQNQITMLVKKKKKSPSKKEFDFEISAKAKLFALKNTLYYDFLKSNHLI